jgi:hypothetical protein
MVGFLYQGVQGQITQVRVFDGRNLLWDVTPGVETDPTADPLHNLIKNHNRSDLPHPPQVFWGIYLSFTVTLGSSPGRASDLWFQAVGADFTV